MATIKYNVVATVGKRRDEKPNYVRCGVVFESEKGLSMKLDSVPAGNEWNGWFSLYPPDEQKRTEQPPKQKQEESFDDDIPF